MTYSKLVLMSTMSTAMLAFSSCATAPLTITPVNTGSQTSQVQGTRVDTLYAQGRDALMAGDVAAALELFHGARRAGPEDVRVLNGLAVIYDRLGRYDLSANYYESARALEPNSAILQTNVALSNQLRTAQQAGPQQLASTISQDKPTWSTQAPTQSAVEPASIQDDAITEQPIPVPTPTLVSNKMVALAPQIVVPNRPVTVATPILRKARSVAQVRPLNIVDPTKPNWSRPAVIIINSSGTPGQAGRTAGHLRNAGWNIAHIGNQRPYNMETTLITYGSGQRQQAIAVARTIRSQFGGNPVIAPRASIGNIRVLLGRDVPTAQPKRARQA